LERFRGVSGKGGMEKKGDGGGEMEKGGLV